MTCGPSVLRTERSRRTPTPVRDGGFRGVYKASLVARIKFNWAVGIQTWDDRCLRLVGRMTSSQYRRNEVGLRVVVRRSPGATFNSAVFNESPSRRTSPIYKKEINVREVPKVWRAPYAGP
jgi:hypothetical protein